jgi:hypothetical protein
MVVATVANVPFWLVRSADPLQGDILQGALPVGDEWLVVRVLGPDPLNGDHTGLRAQLRAIRLLEPSPAGAAGDVP